MKIDRATQAETTLAQLSSSALHATLLGFILEGKHRAQLKRRRPERAEAESLVFDLMGRGIQRAWERTVASNRRDTHVVETLPRYPLSSPATKSEKTTSIDLVWTTRCSGRQRTRFKLPNARMTSAFAPERINSDRLRYSRTRSKRELSRTRIVSGHKSNEARAGVEVLTHLSSDRRSHGRTPGYQPTSFEGTRTG